MQIAALKPMAVTRENMPKEIIEKEKEIYLSQVKSSGKPEKIWDRIVDGKLNKFFKQASLLEQEFIKDSNSTVTDRIKLVEKENEIKINASSFVRFELGVED
jgi:elongation factor Ts